MKVLNLTLKRQWFEMIASGEKTEEYREKNDYWISRLCDFDKCLKTNSYEHFKDFNAVHFYNGWACSTKYQNFQVVCNGIELREGKPEWGAEPGKKYFVIKLGERIHTHSDRGNEYVTPMTEGVDVVSPINLK
jgi:hypothetical protein